MANTGLANGPIRLARALCECVAFLAVGFAAGYATHGWLVAPRAIAVPATDCCQSSAAPTSMNLAEIRERLGRELAQLRSRERLLEAKVKAGEVSRELLHDRGYNVDSRAYQQNEERHKQAAAELEDVRIEIAQVALLDERIEAQLPDAALGVAGADPVVVREALRLVLRLEAQRGQRSSTAPLSTGEELVGDAGAAHAP